MKLFSKVFLFLAAILLTAHMVEAKSPSTSEVKNALSQELPSYVKLTDFTVEASQNLGTDVEPLWGVRFNARIITSSDLYVRDKSENNVVFVFLRTKNNSKIEIFGQIRSHLYQGKWRHSVNIDGNTVDNLGLPLNKISQSGYRVIIRGSKEENAYYDNLHREGSVKSFL